MSSAVVRGQTTIPAAGVFTLDEALQLSQARSEAVAIAQAGVRRAAADVRLTRSALFPQLMLQAGYDRTLATEFKGVFGPTTNAPTCPSFSPMPAAPLADRVAEIERAIDCGAIVSGLFGGNAANTLPFGRTNAWRFNLTFSQSVFDAATAAQVRAARATTEAAGLTLTSARAQVLFDVTQAYYDAALAERLVAIAEATLAQSQATLRQAQDAFNAGVQPEFELLRARVNRDTQQPVLIRRRAVRDVAMLRLRQMLDLPASTRLQLADTLSDAQLPPPRAFAERVDYVEARLGSVDDPDNAFAPGAAIPARTAVNQAATNVRSAQATLDAARAERLPSFSLESSYGRVAYSVFPALGDFRTNWTVGASLNVPILTGGRIAANAAAAEAQVDAARLQLQQTQELADLDSRQALAELVAARAAWEATAGTIEQADRAYQIAGVRYRNGVSTQLELSDSQLALEQAQANRAQAARDLQVARARVALLPALPLGTTPAGGSVVPSSPTTPQQSAPQPIPTAPLQPSAPSATGGLTAASASPRVTTGAAR
jgi:outer membrane protein TolC